MRNKVSSCVKTYDLIPGTERRLEVLGRQHGFDICLGSHLGELDTSQDIVNPSPAIRPKFRLKVSKRHIPKGNFSLEVPKRLDGIEHPPKVSDSRSFVLLGNGSTQFSAQ